MYYREGGGRSFHRIFTRHKTTFGRTVIITFTAKGSLVVNCSSNVGGPTVPTVLRPDDRYYVALWNANWQRTIIVLGEKPISVSLFFVINLK